MRCHWLALVLGMTLAPGAARAAEPFHRQVEGAAATLSFNQTLVVGGCTVTVSGNLVAVQTRSGDGPGFGAAFVGTYDDSCSGPHALVGGNDGELSANGLASAAYRGSIVAGTYDGSAIEITLDVAVDWTGTGAVSTQKSTYTDHSGATTVDFSFTAARAASLGGAMSIGGEAGSISNGALYSSASGEIEVVR